MDLINNKNSDDYDKKYMKLKFNSDDELPLNKMIEIHGMTIVVRIIFHGNNKYYPQVFINEYNMINIKMLHCDRTDVSEGIVCNNTSKLSECNICHHWYFLNKKFKFQTFVWNRCHDLLMMSMNLGYIAIINIEKCWLLL